MKKERKFGLKEFPRPLQKENGGITMAHVIAVAGRIAGLVKEQDLNPSFMGLIVNRAPDGKLNAGTAEEIEKQGLKLLGVIPQDEEVYQYDCDGRPTVELPEGSPVREALDSIIRQLKL